MKRKIKRKISKNDGTNFKELFFETSRDLGSRFIIYTILASVIFVIGKFSWWAGFILFIILSVNLLSEFLLNGFVLVVMVFTTAAYSFAYLKLKATNKHTKKLDDVSSILWMNLPYGIYCLFLLALVGLLFVFFFHEFLL